MTVVGSRHGGRDKRVRCDHNTTCRRKRKSIEGLTGDSVGAPSLTWCSTSLESKLLGSCAALGFTQRTNCGDVAASDSINAFSCWQKYNDTVSMAAMRWTPPGRQRHIRHTLSHTSRQNAPRAWLTTSVRTRASSTGTHTPPRPPHR